MLSDASLYTLDANAGLEVPEAADHDKDAEFSLGSPAKDVYAILSGMHRQQVIDMGREMAEITIPSVMPPLNYRVGDYLPGTNQSVGARAVNNLASKLMFMAFPPGQPMMRLVVSETKMAKDIQADPELYAQIELALSRVELSHRERASTIQLATAWVGYCKLLLVAGNALWKHVTMGCPTFHPLTQWACTRDMKGHPIVTIHEEVVRLSTLDADVQEQILTEQPELRKTEEWVREATLFSVCKFVRHETSEKYEDGHWEYWEETEKGFRIDGTEIETDYDAPPMWAGWCIPVYGQNYGRSYCEEYRGDLFVLENSYSALNDGAAMASLALTFVKPGGRTSLQQVRKAKNLAFLSGSAEDLSSYRTDKSADFNFVLELANKAEQRIGQAFLVNASVMRQGERVTAEEVERTGQDLDQAMGGLYTELAQGHQRKMVTRFVRLHEESDDTIPELPPDLVKIQVITGVDAMGRSKDQQNLLEFGKGINATFPPNSEASTILDPEDFATRFAATMGIKPEGLVQSQQEVAAKKQQQEAAAQSANVASKVAGPVAGPLAKAMASHMQAPPQQQSQPPAQQQGAQ